MHMYDELFSLATDGPLTMQIVADTTNHTLTINVIPQPADKQTARATRALSLTATPDEFAVDFFTALSEYRCAHHTLLAQAVAQVQAVRASSGKLPPKPVRGSTTTAHARTSSAIRTADSSAPADVPSTTTQPSADNDVVSDADTSPQHLERVQRPAPVQTALFN